MRQEKQRVNKIVSQRMKSIDERFSKNVLKAREDFYLIDIIRPILIKSDHISGCKHELFHEFRMSIENGVFFFFFTKIVYFDKLNLSEVDLCRANLNGVRFWSSSTKRCLLSYPYLSGIYLHDLANYRRISI